MATNQTVESPNFEKINKEAGQFTSDAVNLLWTAVNDTRATERRDFRQRQLKVITKSASASVDNLDLEETALITVVSFTGGSAQNFTGARAPETGQSRLLVVQVNGAGTITIKHNATSETANQFVNSSGADLARATGTGAVYIYLESKWRQVV